MPPKKKTGSVDKSGSSQKSKSKSKKSKGASQEQPSNNLGTSQQAEEEGSQQPIENSGEGASKSKQQTGKSGSGEQEGREEKEPTGEQENLQNSQNSKASKKNRTVNASVDESMHIGNPVLTNSITNLKDQSRRPEYVPPGEPRPTNCLVVTLTNFEFVRDFHYFVNLQLGKTGEKKRTEVSNLIKNPVFRTNTFTLPLEQKSLEFHQELYFSVFNVLGEEDYSREHADEQHAGEARLLGECLLGLVPLKPQLIDPNGQGVKQSLKFTRKTKTGEVTVGRFVANIKLYGGAARKDDSVVVSQVIPDRSIAGDRNPNQSDIVRPLPKSDGYLFHWRVRIDCRSAVDLALNRDTPKGLPSSFVEAGLTAELNTRPAEETLQVTKTVPDERNPIWNTQLLLVREQEADPAKTLFVYLAVVDKGRRDKQPLDALWIPVHKLAPFVPLHLELTSASYEFQNRAKLYFSVVLEELDPASRIDQYADVVVHKADHDPLPEKVKRFWIAMTLFNFVPNEIEFYPVDLEQHKSLDGLLDKLNKLFEARRVFLSSIFKLPPMQVPSPHQIELFFKGIALFSLPSSLLNKNIRFFLVYREEANHAVYHFMPNSVAGRTDLVDTRLENMFLYPLLTQLR